jgi:long-subunit acyl-CoA synthetase (AMP-forming)
VSLTVVGRLERAARAHAARPAFAVRDAGGWRTTSWEGYRELVFRAAAGLARLGVGAGDGVAIHAANRPEWAIADLAAIAAGAVPAGLFVTASAEQCAFVLEHAGARVVVVDTAEALAKLLPLAPRLPRLERFVVLDGAEESPRVLSWTALLELGERAGEAGRRELRARLAEVHDEQVATLIYTSGTTGAPKGVELTHASLRFIAEFGARLAHRRGAEERQLSYLPLAHVAEQMLTVQLPLESGSCVHYVPAIERMPEALREVRPTHLFGVPRVWEKLGAAVEQALEGAPAATRALVGWARRRALDAARALSAGGRPSWSSRLADRLVLAKIRERIGLDRAAICGTAAAPIGLATLERFFSLGVPLYEVYGLSETTAILTASSPERFRIGSVGRAVPGVEVRIAEDGEILGRGPNRMRGYRNDPEATRAAIDADGWFHTGDVGELDADGFLRITGRKKELIVTSVGKKIAPSPIENRLREIDGVGHAVVVGDRRNYVAALLTLDAARLPPLAARLGSPARTPAEGARCPRVRAFLEAEVERVNAGLARYESVRRFAVLEGELSVTGGELTPSLKVRRKVVVERWADRIEALYAEEAGPG